ncbi:MAG: 3-deoxy-7-phosphoheptulonate synthase [Chloroflexi bacterium]|nr:3-deoxy-7-phosphoheptulonate synthase [Chloroflexota bacterium]
MIVIMNHRATPEQIQTVINHVESLGYRVHRSDGTERTILGIIGDERPLDTENLEAFEGVERVVRVLHPFKLASREFHPENSVVRVNGIEIGGDQLVLMAGPCSVESREQLFETAAAVKEAGAHILRGGAFKPRTSPYAFQGLGLKGLELLREAREKFHLPIVTEVLAPQDVSLVAQYADILQIGARNMQNFALLRAVGEVQKPVLLKRGMMATIEEWLMAAEYILAQGNSRVILCERGIRTFETATRNTFDINAIPLIKQLSHLPVIADPSHGTGRWDLVIPVSRAAIAAGADGLIIEVHPHPEQALSDGAQSLRPDRFASLVEETRRLAEVLGRRL